MPTGNPGKHKGGRGPSRRGGMARQRHVGRRGRTRPGDLSTLGDAEDMAETPDDDRRGDSAEHVLKRFNRLARDEHVGDGDEAMVCGFDGPVVLVRDRNGGERPCQIRQVLKKMLTGVSSPLAVGDEVRVITTPEGDHVIAAIAPRTNQLTRTDSHNQALDHVIAANIDRVVIVAAIAQPPLRSGLIDRYLVIAHFNDIAPVIVINKCDLGDHADIVSLYQDLGYPVFATVAKASHPAIDDLRQHLNGQACVFTGQSGVGKSSLINALYPDLDLRVAAVSDAIGKGRHTTTSARSFPVPGGGALIDTPGIRAFGIGGLTPLDVALLYPDIARHHHDCRFHNCLHRHEPGCAVKAAVTAGTIAPSRYLSYRSIIEEDLGAGA